ncbi:MAG: branched-chain amino acid ABC transporter permease [Sutterellaceae bacterium]|nr:branched-chain amino acid ABC transporter permease [Sutterellaceae bacterium]
MTDNEDSLLTSTNRNSRSQSEIFMDGVRCMNPFAIPVLVWGVITGIAMANSSLTVDEALGMSLFVYAGSVQIASLALIDNRTPIWMIAFTAIILNLRLMIYSATIQGHFKHQPLKKRFIMASLSGDILYAPYLKKFPIPGNNTEAAPYFLGIAVSVWINWQTSSIAGILVAEYLPKNIDLSFASTLVLIALIRPVVTDKTSLLVSILAIPIVLGAAQLPLKLNLLLAILFAVAAGNFIERNTRGKL